MRDLVPAERRAAHVVRRDGRALLLVRDLEPALQIPVLREFESFARGLPPRPGRVLD